MDELSLRRRVELLEEEVRDLHRRLGALSRADVSVASSMDPVAAPMIVEPEAAPVVLPPSLPITFSPPEPMPSVQDVPILEEDVTKAVEEEPVAPVVKPVVALQESMPNTELWMGQVWAVRIGVLLLFTGFVFLANYAWEHYISQLGAMPRLLMLTVLSLGGVVVGEIMRRKPRLGTFGEVITAGGLAALYYCAYAAHHIERLRVIDQASVGAVLLTLTGLGILGYGVWRRAAVMCSIALLLSFYGTSIQPVALTAMISGLIVAATGAWICVRYRWKSLGVVGLLGAYVAYILWQGLTHGAEAFSLSVWFLCCYWILYNAVVLSRGNPWNERESVVICALNHGLLAAFLPFDWSRFAWDSHAWMVHAVLGVVVLTLWLGLEKLRGRNRLSEAHLVQGIGLLTLAAVTKWSGHELFVVLGVKALVLFSWDRWSKRLSVECCAWALVLLSMWIAMLSMPTEVARSVWMLYAGILFVGLCVARRNVLDEEPLRELTRWVMAGATLGVLYFGVLATLPDSHGGMWMIGISLLLCAVARFSSERFPAPEIVPLAAISAITAEVALWMAGNSLSADVLLGSAGLAMAHAMVHPQSIASWKTPTAREFSGMMLVLGAWMLIGAYGWIHLPFGEWTACSAAVLLGAVHLVATRLKWDLLSGVSPLFSLAILMMSYPFMADGVISQYAAYFLLLGYAAWLSLRESKGLMMAFPLLCSMAGLIVAFSQENHGSIYLLVLALALAFTPLRKHLLWRSVMIIFAVISFLHYLEESSGHWLTYVVPVLWYGALAYRARIMRLGSTSWTKTVAVLITVTMAWKVSEWVGFDGGGQVLTITWALLAALCFGLGFAVREPVMRVMMLLLLLASMGRILVSVWQLGTLMRIASFLVTGVIFLLLGYVYNKHPEWFGRSDDAEPQPAPEENLESKV
jgi:hypothetical protein